jgi:hypothetical protein
MTRKLSLFVQMAVFAAFVTAHLGVLHGVARGQSTQPVLKDNFNDNRRGTLWRTHTEGTGCQVQEVNARLEFTATGGIVGDFAGYVGDKWSIDPNHDFEMRLTLNYDVQSLEGGWLTFGVTPDPTKPRDRYVSFGIACNTLFPSYWREWKDGYEVRWTFADRGHNQTTLYLSYDSDTDTIYMAESGYGADNAWEAVSDCVRNRWGRKPIYVFFGLYTEGAAVGAGHAYVDDFALDTAVLTNTKPTNPTDPNNGSPGGQVDVPAEVSILPAAIRRLSGYDPITAFIALPKGYLPSDIDSSAAAVMVPGNAQAAKQTIFVWLSGQTIVIASFDRAKLLEAVEADGEVSVQVTGRFKGGLHFGGTDTITIQ